jgi:hypothetical protein
LDLKQKISYLGRARGREKKNKEEKYIKIESHGLVVKADGS